jgi:hypothetical protein
VVREGRASSSWSRARWLESTECGRAQLIDVISLLNVVLLLSVPI